MGGGKKSTRCLDGIIYIRLHAAGVAHHHCYQLARLRRLRRNPAWAESLMVELLGRMDPNGRMTQRGQFHSNG